MKKSIRSLVINKLLTYGIVGIESIDDDENLMYFGISSIQMVCLMEDLLEVFQYDENSQYLLSDICTINKMDDYLNKILGGYDCE